MACSLSASIVGSMALLLGSLPAAAQLYHLGSDELPNGMLQWYLVNDSDKPIEAFRAEDHCIAPDGKSHSAGLAGGDSLLSPPDSSLIQTYGGKTSPSGRLERDGKWMIGSGDTNTCETKITAVVYSDGTHDGSEDAVKVIVALRKGREERDRFWLDRLKREEAEDWSLERIHSDAHQLQAQSFKLFLPLLPGVPASINPKSPLQVYLGSRDAVDSEIVDSLSHVCRCPTAAALSSIIQKLQSELERFDADVSNKVLDAEFPMSFTPDAEGHPTSSQTSE
jgi:hypothetical protein